MGSPPTATLRYSFGRGVQVVPAHSTDVTWAPRTVVTRTGGTAGPFGRSGTVPAVLPIPSVSVCIPVYNGELFLAETIRSVLDQTYRDFELVVLDNASTDATGRIARSFGDPRVRVETNPSTIVQPENWRAAVRLCRAPLIKLLC